MIPKGFNPSTIVPSSFRSDRQQSFKDGACYFVSLLIPETINKRKWQQLFETGYIQLSATILHNIIGASYKQVVETLEAAGIIEVNHSYIIGEQSMGYRLAKMFAGEMVEYELTTKGINERLQAYQKKKATVQKRRQKELNHLTKWINKNYLSIDVNGATQFITEYEEQFTKLMKETTVSTTEQQQDMLYRVSMRVKQMKDCVSQISTGNYEMIRDANGRIYSPLTSLKRELRSFIRLDGEKVGSLDIKASQPYLLTLLLKKAFWQTTKKLPITLRSANPTLYATLVSHLTPIITFTDFFGRLENSAFEGFTFPKINWAGDFYTHLQQQVKQEDDGNLTGKYFETRANVKSTMMLLLYDTYFDKQPVYYQMFKKLYPNETDLMDMIKKIDPINKGIFPSILQTVEAELVLNCVTKQIAKQEPAMPMFTVHDGIFIPASKLHSLQSTVENTIEEAVLIKPGIKLEVMNDAILLQQVAESVCIEWEKIRMGYVKQFSNS